MASPRQKGFLKLKKGSLGDTTFIQSKDGYRAREKKPGNKKRWKLSPKYKKQRNRAGEFTYIAVTAKLVRRSIKRDIPRDKDGEMQLKLLSHISKMLNLDKVHQLGERILLPENLVKFIGFEFNSGRNLKAAFNWRFNTTVNNETGEVTIVIPSFIPADRVHPPKGATHFRFITIAAKIDFTNKTYKSKSSSSEKLLLDETPTPDLTFLNGLPTDNSLPVFVFLGLEFTNEMGTTSFAVANQKMNPMCLVDVVV